MVLERCVSHPIAFVSPTLFRTMWSARFHHMRSVLCSAPIAVACGFGVPSHCVDAPCDKKKRLASMAGSPSWPAGPGLAVRRGAAFASQSPLSSPPSSPTNQARHLIAPVPRDESPTASPIALAPVAGSTGLTQSFADVGLPGSVRSVGHHAVGQHSMPATFHTAFGRGAAQVVHPTFPVDLDSPCAPVLFAAQPVCTAAGFD